MRATDELHRMLTKAGVEYRFNDATKVFEWHFDGTDGEGSACATEVDGGINIMACSITPAQAIAATVGTGMLTAEQVSNATYAHSIHADCADADWQAIADELNDTLGRGTCHMVYNDLANLSRCTACGWRMNGVPMYYCPRCGRRVVNE